MSIGYYIRRAREIGVQETWLQGRDILLHHASAFVRQAYDEYFRREAGAAKVIGDSGFQSANQLADHLRRREDPAFFVSEALLSQTPTVYERYPEQAEALIERANCILQHQFDLLGSGPVNLDDPSVRQHRLIADADSDKRHHANEYLPWHIDFKSGAGWEPGTYYKRIRYGSSSGVDVKIPWELSRFQHLIVLGQAYQLTGDVRYTLEFCRQVDDWIDTNPCRFGVNWACTMEVGIRAVNWIWAFYLFRKCADLSDEFIVKFLASLNSHALFILGNLEYREASIQGRRRRLNSNHYLSNLIGVLYIALLFPELNLRDKALWAARELETELNEETTVDGVDYEHSTSYHRLVLEIFLSGFLLLRLNGNVVPESVEARLIKMARFVADYSRPDASAPQIGDNDNGRLHPLSIRRLEDHLYLARVVANALNAPDLNVGGSDPEVWWWVGKDFVREPAARSSAAFPNPGFYVMRCKNLNIFASAAEVGMHGYGSHSHNDLLSFEYWASGQPWIVDPGTYLYTPDPNARNLFRSTAFHNSVRVDGREINPIRPDHLFQLAQRAHVIVHGWESNDQTDILDIEHDGFIDNNVGVYHRRQFRLDKEKQILCVKDSFRGSAEHRFEWFLNLHPSITPVIDGNVLQLSVKAKTVKIDIPPRLTCDIRPSWYSPSYGIRNQSSVVVLTMISEPPFATELFIYPE